MRLLLCIWANVSTTLSNDKAMVRSVFSKIMARFEIRLSFILLRKYVLINFNLLSERSQPAHVAGSMHAITTKRYSSYSASRYGSSNFRNCIVLSIGDGKMWSAIRTSINNRLHHIIMIIDEYYYTKA